jgi:hypothetical protein
MADTKLRMTTREMLEAIAQSIDKLRDAGKAFGVEPARMAFMGTEWPLWCVQQEIEARYRDEVEAMRNALREPAA